MEDIISKYNRLDNEEKKKIKDFIDFLLTKRKKIDNDKLSEYKKKILAVSEWSDEDIDLIRKNKKAFQRWQPKEW